MHYQRRALIYPFLLGCLALACLPGCGKPKATVKGKVTFNNQPLSAGSVAFIDGKGHTGSGTIKSDGTYVVNDAPVGDVTIAVETPRVPRGPVNMAKPPPGVKGMPKEMLPPGYEEGKPVRIVPAPEQYSKAETSPLKFTVQPGSQDHNIELKP
jgi:hypothetical protein